MSKLTQQASFQFEAATISVQDNVDGGGAIHIAGQDEINNNGYLVEISFNVGDEKISGCINVDDHVFICIHVEAPKDLIRDFKNNIMTAKAGGAKLIASAKVFAPYISRNKGGGVELNGGGDIDSCEVHLSYVYR